MTEPTDALIPCPFCGASSEVENDFGTTWWVQCHGGQHTDGMLYGSRAEAVTAWNTRTPQPTQAQAGAVPLTDEQITAAAKKLAECMEYPWEFMPEPGRKNMRKHAQDVIEAAHGIKGGQHG